jgi:uncharacterized protein
MRAMIIPGNGDSDMDWAWYQYAKRELEKLGISVTAEKMPDADLARKEYWLPFIEKKVGEGDVLLIGHSSGAVAILRYLETHKIKGAVIVAGCHTDLGDEKEKASHYFDTPWNWEAIRKNADWIIQFASISDPFIPIEEARFIHEKTHSAYHEMDKGHFGPPADMKTFPELIAAIKKKIQ